MAFVSHVQVGEDRKLFASSRVGEPKPTGDDTQTAPTKVGHTAKVTEKNVLHVSSIFNCVINEFDNATKRNIMSGLLFFLWTPIQIIEPLLLKRDLSDIEVAVIVCSWVEPKEIFFALSVAPVDTVCPHGSGAITSFMAVASLCAELDLKCLQV